MEDILNKSKGYCSPKKWTWNGNVGFEGGFMLSNGSQGQSEITFDYERAEGGLPFINTTLVTSSGEPVIAEIIFSETFEGLQRETGDGPFFLFSNAMSTYRSHTLSFEPSTSSDLVRLSFAQRSQRYQRLTLKTPNSSLSISHVGFSHIRQPNPTKSTFTCSNENLNKIWTAGVRTLDMCTVEAGETAEAWEVTEAGTRIHGQHWAPCRRGTRWEDKSVLFEVKIENRGASWGIHMVANGLIFCLNKSKGSLTAFEGLSDTNGVFPSIPRGSWNVDPQINLDEWISIKTVASGSFVSVQINEFEIASINDLDIHPILGGSGNNTGSVTFGGPDGFVGLYRSLEVTDAEGQVLYENNLRLEEKARTLADFAVGTNALSCTIDGAKRDRALFGGDLFVMGRSIYYSTANMEAILGSIKLLTSHQTKDGYLGNLCPIQAPVHEEAFDPPTYAFYSLSYALLLLVAIKDYWMYSGDAGIIRSIWHRLEKLISFTERLLDERGLVVAPPPLSMDWFPMGGPIFGASGKINLAYYDSLTSMSKMCLAADAKDEYTVRAERLKGSIVAHLWNKEAGIMRMSDTTSRNGICQDINAYATTIGVSPFHSRTESVLAAPGDFKLPVAFQGIERWDQNRVVSPYASGFAAEALFERNHGLLAVELIERVWGIMVDQTNPNYSGGHWEAMKPNGTPITDDTSLMHGWSTWPVYLLPRYLAGIEPLEPGWSRWRVKPILTGLESVEVQLATPAGDIKVILRMQESRGTGEMHLKVPFGTIAEAFAPEGWIIITSNNVLDSKSLKSQPFSGREEVILIRLCRMYESMMAAKTVSFNKDDILATAEGIATPESSLDKKRGCWSRPESFFEQFKRWLFA